MPIPPQRLIAPGGHIRRTLMQNPASVGQGHTAAIFTRQRVIARSSVRLFEHGQQIDSMQPALRSGCGLTRRRADRPPAYRPVAVSARAAAGDGGSSGGSSHSPGSGWAVPESPVSARSADGGGLVRRPALTPRMERVSQRQAGTPQSVPPNPSCTSSALTSGLCAFISPRAG